MTLAPDTHQRPHFWFLLSSLYVLLLISALAYFIYDIEFFYIDDFHTLSRAHLQSWRTIIPSVFRDSVEYRPLFHLLVKAVYDIAGGPDVVVFRTLHFIMLLALGLLFLDFARPITVGDCLACVIAFTCLIGLHTSTFLLFAKTLNMYLIIILLALLAVRMLHLRGSIVIDIAAIAISWIALFFIELGAIVSIVFLAGYLLKLRGISIRAVFGIVAGLVFYAALRVSLSVKPFPGAFYTETGFLFRTLTVHDQHSLFGNFPVVFYLYNVLCSALTVLLSEPRSGGFQFIHQLVTGQPRLWQWVNVGTSAMTTLLIAAWVMSRRWNEREAKFLVIAASIFAVNATFGFLYTRDRIASPSGVFYSLALFLALRDLLGTWHKRRASNAKRVVVACLVVMITFGWSLRAADAFFFLRRMAKKATREWTVRADLISKTHGDPKTLELIALLRTRALRKTVPDPCKRVETFREIFEDC